MEKLLRSNNSIVMNQLPRIFNIMQILNMMVYGFVNNQPILFVQAIGSIQKSIQLPSRADLRTWLVKQLQACVRFAYYTLLTVTALLLVLSNYFTDNALIVAGSLSLLSIVIRYFILGVRRKLLFIKLARVKYQLVRYRALIRSTVHTLISPIHYCTR